MKIWPPFVLISLRKEHFYGNAAAELRALFKRVKWCMLWPNMHSLSLHLKIVSLYLLFERLQLNLHETNLSCRYLCHHLTQHCSSISKDLHRFARNLQHLLAKLFLLLLLNNFTTETITKTLLRANATNILQICANLQKQWNNAMSNDGSSIEIIDQSHEN